MGGRALRAGFTILEVVLAASVMAFAIATSVSTLVVGVRAMDSARATTMASQILQDQMEELRTTHWSVVSAWDVSVDTPVSLNQGMQQNAFIQSHSYSCSRTVNLVPGKASLRQVSFTVAWKGADGRPHAAIASTFYAQSGLYSYVSL